MRATLLVAVALVARLFALIDRLVLWMSAGSQIAIEDEAATADAGLPDQLSKSNPSSTVVARTLDDLVRHDVDRNDAEISPLYDDIQAAARVEWGYGEEITAAKT
jgi:hypothetical protein